jgi:hypothetical protein
MISFMPARPHEPPITGAIDARAAYADPEHLAQLGPAILDEWNSRFVAQLAASATQAQTASIGDGPVVTYLFDLGRESFAALVPTRTAGTPSAKAARSPLGRHRGRDHHLAIRRLPGIDACRIRSAIRGSRLHGPAGAQQQPPAWPWVRLAWTPQARTPRRRRRGACRR